MIKAIFFDLDGTLLPMDEDKFIKIYFSSLSERMIKFGYEPNKLIESIWLGTKAMYKNDGLKTNEEVFWDTLVSIYGKDILQDIDKFNAYYVEEFDKTIKGCNENPLAREIIDFCKSNVKHVVLATNPIFPSIATKKRMGFVGLNESDFDFVTTYENFSFSKPNPKYFMELLKKFDLKPHEVIMFGNNTLEDGECSFLAGIKCYIVEGSIINDPRSIHDFEVIKMEEIISKIKFEIEKN